MSSKKISPFMLTMFNVSVMASLRNLPLVAEFGYTALPFFLIVALLFLLPSALLSAELATAWPKSGGIYVWVKEALGERWGFFAIWMQWIHNIPWYPAILSFVIATLMHVFFPSHELSSFSVFSLIVGIFWIMTLFNYAGLKASNLLSTIGVIGGTLIPGILIIILGVLWILSGEGMQIHFTFQALIPSFKSLDNLSFLGGLFLAFAGLEVSAGYASEVEEPRKNFPKAILSAALITLFLFTLGALAIAIVIPKGEISLVSGVIEALEIFLSRYRLSSLLPLMGIAMALGALAEVNSWIIGPIKALSKTREEHVLPPLFYNNNRHGMPTHLLLFQAIVVTLSALVFLLVPTLSSAYWILSALAVQIYSVMYILLFLSAIILRYKKPDVERPYRVGMGNKAVWVLGISGILSSTFILCIVFVPPRGLPMSQPYLLPLLLFSSLLTLIALPFLIDRKRSTP